MKHRILTAVAPMAIALSLSAANRTLFVHHTAGVDPILYAEIEQIRFSYIDLDSVECSYPVVQEIWTVDSVYRYAIADILSTSFEAPATEARDNAIDLSGELASYIIGTRTDEDGILKINLSTSTPARLMPQEGDCLYQLSPSEWLPYGLAARDVGQGTISYVWKR